MTTPFNVDFGTAPGPDGRIWVMMRIRTGLSESAFVFPPEDGFRDQLLANMRGAFDAARVANGGIIVPTLGPLPKDLTTPPTNGHR